MADTTPWSRDELRCLDEAAALHRTPTFEPDWRRVAMVLIWHHFDRSPAEAHAEYARRGLGAPPVDVSNENIERVARLARLSRASAPWSPVEGQGQPWTAEELELLQIACAMPEHQFQEKNRRCRMRWQLVENFFQTHNVDRTANMCRNALQRVRSGEYSERTGVAGGNRCTQCGALKKGHKCSVLSAPTELRCRPVPTVQEIDASSPAAADVAAAAAAHLVPSSREGSPLEVEAEAEMEAEVDAEAEAEAEPEVEAEVEIPARDAVTH